MAGLRKLRQKKGGGKKAASLSPLLQKSFSTAIQHHRAGNFQYAGSIYREILAKKPDHADSLHLLGVITAQEGDLARAEKLIKKAIGINPKMADYHANLGKTYTDHGKYDQALACYRRALKLNPDDRASLRNIARVYYLLKKYNTAILHSNKALQTIPNCADSYLNIGNSLLMLEKFEEAYHHFKRAMDLNPACKATVNHNIGYALVSLGRTEEGIEYLQKSLEDNPENILSLHTLVLNTRFTAMDHEYAVRAEALLKKPNLPAADKTRLHFILGKIADDCRNFREAFGHYARGNAIRNRSARFSVKDFAAEVDGLINLFTLEFLQRKQLATSESKRPVFIIGMPRSGTSLIEQIASSHPQVIGGGELAILGELIDKMPSTSDHRKFSLAEIIQNCSEQRLLDFSEEYLKNLQIYAPDSAARITDKMPYNFRLLGLICLLFPNAYVIHCRRNAMDTCLSNFFQLFEKGNDFAYDLTHLGNYYCQYDRLMQHWTKTLPLPIHEIRYEELVDAPEENIRKLISFLGLEWQDECLFFYQNKRRVETASQWQVRQPIYKKSVERWKNYRQFLGPLKEILTGCGHY